MYQGGTQRRIRLNVLDSESSLSSRGQRQVKKKAMSQCECGSLSTYSVLGVLLNILVFCQHNPHEVI